MALLLVLVGPTLAGCGSDDSDAGGTGEETPTTSASPTSTDPSDGTSSAPAVDPASGPALELGALTVHVPDGWKETPELGKLQVSANSPDPRQFFAVSQVRTPLPDQSLMGQAQVVIDADQFDHKPTTEAIVTIGGEPAFHLRGLTAGNQEDQLGLVVGKYSYTFHFYTDTRLVKKEGDARAWNETIDSILASAEWK